MNYGLYVTKNMIILFVILSVILSMSSFVINDAFAWHDAGQKKWDTTNNAFLCKQSLKNIEHELFLPCAEAIKAAKSWSDVKDSNWIFTYTSGDEAPIYLIGKTPGDESFAAEAIPHYQNGKIVNADIQFSLIKPFTDVSNRNSNVNYYDFESVAFHEFGHLQWVGHSYVNWDSVMQLGLDPNTIRDKPEKHDIDVLKVRYPK